MYIQSLLNHFTKQYYNEPEFLQSIRLFLKFLSEEDFLHNSYKHEKILERLLVPDRSFVFKVTWKDDAGKVHVNLGFRVQFNNVLGPYKGGLRFHAGANLSVFKFLAFEQSLKNALTGTPIGGAMGGSDFEPKGKSDDEIMRFCHYYMLELNKRIDSNIDVPGNDMGVGTREIGYLYGMYKKLNDLHTGVLSGKSDAWGGMRLRREAPGYGLIYFLSEVLKRKQLSLKGKRIVVSGFGRVAWGVIKKANEMGAKVVAISGPDGYVYDEEGIDKEKVEFLTEMGTYETDLVKPYTYRYPEARFHPHKKPWEVKADIAIPCAIENEIDKEEALKIIDAGYSYVIEGANMPCTEEAINQLRKHKLCFIPGKSANSGAVILSAMEMSQNSIKQNFSEQEVDLYLKRMMKEIHDSCVNQFEGDEEDYLKAANKTAFHRLATAMGDMGVV